MQVTLRVRSIVWFATGALLATAVTVIVLNAWRADAAPGDADATLVPITPCRLADTRPGDARVGTAAAFGPEGTQTFAVHGTNGECTIPNDAVAVALNATALGATEQSFMTFWPSGALPEASSLNPAPGEPPTPNAVTVDLSGAGGFNVYNDVGTVNLVLDITGYYIASSLQELASRLAAVEAVAASNEIATSAQSADIARLDAQRPFTVYGEFTPEFQPPMGCFFGSALVPCSFFGTTTDTMQEISLTAPADGTVTVSAVANLSDLASDDGQCQLMDSEGDPDLVRRTVWRGSSASPSEAISLIRSFEVAEGTNATFYVRCRSTNQTAFFGGLMSATWVPSP